MLYEILRHIRNFFPVKGGARSGHFEIENGFITLDFLLNDQYFLIEGSVFNDGVHQYGDPLRDEVFAGTITPLAIPEAFLALVDEIESYQAKYGEAGPYSSESFGGYSYTKATDANGNAASWKTAFASRLNTWRKV